MNSELGYKYEQMDITAAITEAETYYEQGLLNEALELYNDILSRPIELDAVAQNDLVERARQLEMTICESKQFKPIPFPDEIFSMLKQNWPDNAGIYEVLESADACCELGLYKEAFNEYKKLFNAEYPVVKIVSKLLECLFAIHSASKVIAVMEDVIEEQGVDDYRAAEIKFQMAQELEKKELTDLALDLYENIRQLTPAYTEADARIQAIHNSFSFSSRYDYLLQRNIIDTAQLQQALAEAKERNQSVEFVLIKDYNISKEIIGKSLSLFYKCPFKRFDPDIVIPNKLVDHLKKKFLLKDLWVPIGVSRRSIDRQPVRKGTEPQHFYADPEIRRQHDEAEVIEILIDNPGDLPKVKNINLVFSPAEISYHVGIKEDIEAFILKAFSHRPHADESLEFVDSFLDGKIHIEFDEEEPPEDDLDEDVNENSSRIVQFADQIIYAAYRKNASDIHIEPSLINRKTAIRFRIDGVCQSYTTVPLGITPSLLSRLKIMAGLDIAEKRLPQDGKIKFKRSGINTFELRLATLPTAGGLEDAVLRILPEAGTIKLENMRLSERNLEIFKKVISQPYGIILVVGPTGSGKTTMLHSALAHINRPEVKIWTAEDPVEISQLGLRQVEVNNKIGLDFARILRSFLRADPDVIMIGEMRDYETASIGVKASLTGHLVFSTLHTNSAPETVTRLLDMGIDPLNFSDALLGVLAQRLVRKLCRKCRKKYHPSRQEIERIINDYGESAVPQTVSPSELILYRAVGCEECSGTGYKGRVAIHELMYGTKTLKQMIKKNEPTEELFKQAQKDGMTTLSHDGIAKAFEGLTTIDEVRRVCLT